jgi:hypothetical protein
MADQGINRSISAKNREVARPYGCAVGIEKIKAARRVTCAIFSRLILQMPGSAPDDIASD